MEQQKKFSNTPKEWRMHYARKTTSPQRIAEIAHRHDYFFRAIEDHVLRDSGIENIIEIGIGTGFMGMSLRERIKEKGRNPKIIGLDYQEIFLKRAQDYLASIRTNSIGFVSGNANYLPLTNKYRDSTIIFHQGFMEHFSDDQILLMVQEQLRVAKTIFMSVPSEYYHFESGLVGNENLYSTQQWKELLQPWSVHISNYGENPGEEFQKLIIIS